MTLYLYWQRKFAKNCSWKFHTFCFIKELKRAWISSAILKKLRFLTYFLQGQGQRLQGQFSGIGFFFLLFVNCLQNHLSSNFWYYIPNSGTNKRCCMSIVIYRFKILAFYQKLMSEILTSIFRSKNLQFWQTDAI